MPATLLALLAAVAGTACTPLTDTAMTDTRHDTAPAFPYVDTPGVGEPAPPALYRILSQRQDTGGTWATMAAVRTGGNPLQVLLSNPDDIAYLRDPAPKHRMATLLAKNGAAARLLPVTIGLDVSIMGATPGGDTRIMALPRPSPLVLPAALAHLRRGIEQAARAHQPVAFALSDSKTVIDAAPIDRATALEMLGMQERPRS